MKIVFPTEFQNSLWWRTCLIWQIQESLLIIFVNLKFTTKSGSLYSLPQTAGSGPIGELCLVVEEYIRTPATNRWSLLFSNPLNALPQNTSPIWITCHCWSPDCIFSSSWNSPSLHPFVWTADISGQVHALYSSHMEQASWSRIRMRYLHHNTLKAPIPKELP